MANFTSDQLSAVLFRDGNCLVSAGAGSGKTAVLTERIYWLIVPPLDPEFAERYKKETGQNWGPDDAEDPVFVQGAEPLCKASEVLVLTFGKGAAIEMKGRVRDKIRAHPQTAYLLSSVEESDISNFDSFWLKMVNENYFELGLSSPVSIVDGTYVEILTNRFIDGIIEERCKLVLEGKEAEFAGILKEKCIKDTSFIVKGIKSVLDLSSLAKDPDEFFETYEETYLSEEALEENFNAFARYIVSTLRDMHGAIAHLYENNGDDALTKLDQGYLEGYLQCPNFNAMHQHFLEGNDSWPIKPRTATLSDKRIREGIKENAMDAIAMLAKSKEEYLDFARSLRPRIRLFVAMAKAAHQKLQAWMKERACYDFSGVANLMRKLLEIPSVKERLKQKYRYIMLDEYQDTSNTQEDLIQSIARDNVFAVGDIKQSIYRFRKANPKTFYSKLIAYGQGDGGTLVTLADNFRSREQVINGVNEIFKEIMTAKVGGVDYSNNQALRFGNHRDFDASSKMEQYGFQILTHETIQGVPNTITEAELIARDIKSKVESGFVVGLKKGGHRKCEYGDFAVLVSRKSGFEHYVRAFKELGIPLSVHDKEIIGKDDVVIVLKAMLSLLNMLSSGAWDETLVASSCLSLGRSFLCQKADDEIYSLIKGRRYDDFDFFAKLSAIAKEAKSLSLKELFLLLFKEFDFPTALISLGDVEMNYKKCVSLLGVAESLENIGLGLDDMIRYLQDIDDYGTELSVDGGSFEPGAVKIMSDHFSKGLQYKICYFPELFGRFQNDGKSFQATTEFGVCLSSLDPEGKAEADFLSYITAKTEHAENISERLRLFYVALTRAEEMAILVLPENYDEEGNRVEKPPVLIANSTSFQDFFLASKISFPKVPTPPVFKHDEDENPAKTDPISKIQIKKVDAKGRLKTQERASLELKEPIDPGVLQYGIHLHRVMELTDFGKKMLPSGLSPKERAKFEKILSLPLFDNADKGREYHEYGYYDEERDIVGSIDLFIVYDDHIDLIDYKSSSIDAKKYSSQLDSYAHYLSKAFPGKRIDKFLLSIGKAEVNRVD